MRVKLAPGVSLAALAALSFACAGDPGSTANKPPATRVERSTFSQRAVDAGGLVTSVDEDGVPRFIWAAGAQPARHSGTPEQAALEHVARFAPAYGIDGAAGMRVASSSLTPRGDHLVRMVQEVDGIEIYRAELKAVVRSDLSLVALAGSPSRVSAKPADRVFRLTPGQAVSRALGDLYKVSVPDGFESSMKEAEGNDRWVELPGLTAVQLSEPARARKVFFRDGDHLVAAYLTEFYASHDQSTDADAWRYLIAAADGRVLDRHNLTEAEAFNYRVYARNVGQKSPTDGPQVDYTPHPTGTPDNSDPAFVDAVLVSMESFKAQPGGVIDPWLAATATKTTGNNVDAYADLVTPDGYSAGDKRATTTDVRTFDFQYNPTQEPNLNNRQQKAAITNLFYTVNWMHDYWYDSGFDEAAGNAQLKNFGRGGAQNDPIHAEANDFGGINNANMSTPGDGMAPRMQMYLFTGTESRSLEIDPGDLQLATGFAAFGPTDFDTTGDVVLADDGTAPNTDACQPLVNDVAGRIVLIDRGTCSFALKTLAAENAGAIGVLIANNVAGAPPPNLGNTVPPTTVTIPTLAITMEDGTSIKTMLGSGTVTARMFRDVGTARNGAIDNMVIGHEWGHYLHHRLSDCSTFQCGALSEGWGDFISLHRMLSAGDNLDGTFGMGIYAPRAFGDSAYFGIRRFPYSVDPSKNALSFRHIQNAETLPATPINPNAGANSEVHNAGEIWASMLFEAYVSLQKNPNGRSFGQVKRAMADYVVLGLELAPVDATYTETRDAILAAVQMTNPGDLQVMADAFARRGAGTCAEGPPASASGDLTPVTESFTTSAAVDILSIELDDSVDSCDLDGILDSGETGRVTVQVANKGPAAMTDTTVTVSSSTPGVVFPGSPSANIATLGPYEVATVTIDLGLDSSVTTMTVLDLTVTVDNEGACVPSTVDSRTPVVNADEVAKASATETVEVRDPPWSMNGMPVGTWSRVETGPGDHAWQGKDNGFNSDVRLVSPILRVDGSGAPFFVISFDHAHSFEQPAFDGGVIEISNDNGATWQDVSAFATPGYNGTIVTGGGNALEGRSAFINTNPSFPATDPVTLDFGNAFAGENVRIRFRVGSDVSVGAPGWTIDDIAVTGISNTPFGVVVDDDGVCTP